MIKFFFIFIILFFILYWLVDTFYHFLSLKQKPSFHYSVKFNLFSFLFDYIPKRLSEYFAYIFSDEFNASGLIIYCGPQGSGKSYSMCHEVTELWLKYPDSKIYSNMVFEMSDFFCDTWEPLIYAKNGNSGIIFMFDEISLWFNSRFRDLPPEVLQEIVQNRKNHRVIFGTAQNISMVDKQIRLQCTEYRDCFCFLNSFVVCMRWHPVFDFEGNLLDKKFRGLKIYFQDDIIRASYDTYATIERLGKLGFNYQKPDDITISVKEKKTNEKKSFFKNRK